MEFGLVTVARAAQIPAARATIDSARQSGFTGAVHAVALGIDVDSATIDGEWISVLSVMPEAAAPRRLSRFGVATPPQPSRFADWYSLGVDRPRDDGLTVTVGEHVLVSIDVYGRDARHPHRLDAGQPLPHRVTLSELPTLAAALESRPTVS